ncbi:MAG: cation-translocating P-type ATPase, partial [Alphaproteobacteria bacterium]|nr:cation-translocating P-type ATPase [Alphaproteobacteria bacterium]
QAVRDAGLTPIMISGDNPAAVAVIAKRLGLTDARAGVAPDMKAAAIRELQAQHGGVAFVGDGVNDAPALAAADLGLAMGSGADAAISAADITLLQPDPRLAPAALDIAARIRAKVRQNLFWAFAYNAVGLPLAMLGYLTPAFAGLAMALSSVSVVGNALLLRRWKARL